VIGFVNVSKTTCTLTGYPEVVALDVLGKRVGHARQELSGMLGGLQNGAKTPPTVTLRPGQPASATVEGSDNPVGTARSCPWYPFLLVNPPDETHSVKVGVPGIWGHGFPDCTAIRVDPVVPGRTGQLS
jgi:hypothetical protein